MADEKQRYPTLENSMRADVAIVGGGITGLLSADLLAGQGKKVVILEKDTIGSGATHDTTAFMTQVIDTTYVDLINMVGADNARLVADSHRQGAGIIEAMVTKEAIDCDFVRCSNFLYANTLRQAEGLAPEAQAMKASGIDATVHIGAGKLGFIQVGYIEIKNQAKFNAAKFIEALAKKLEKKGVTIFEKSKADSIASRNGAVSVRAGSHQVSATTAIVATYEPFNKPLSLYFKKGFYTSYVISASLPRGIIKEAIYEDTENPYHYFRIDSDGASDVITLGGEDHRSALPLNRKKMFHNLENYLTAILPGVDYRITQRWSGPILEPADGLPSIGPLGKDKISYAMAFSGNGMTYGAIAAQIFADTINSKPNPWSQLYAANRVPSLPALLIKGWDYSQQMLRGIRNNIF